MNFVETFKAGKEGKNFGLTTGIGALDLAINRIQRKTSYGVAAAPKVGKTTFVDFAFVISPYLEAERMGKLDKVKWTYFSYEIDRINKEFKYAAFFMAYDFKVYTIVYKSKVYAMNQDYLMGTQVHRNPDGSTEPIPITPEHEQMLKEIYQKRIIPLFGEFYPDGTRIPGVPFKIDYIEDPENPTGLHKHLFHYAKQHGDFIEEPYTIVHEDGKKEVKTRVVGYRENDPEMYHIFVMDHVRKLRKERGFNMKENIDKWLEYTTWHRNIWSAIFVNICHSNRDLGSVDRLRFMGEHIYPTADDVKDTGNLAEESTMLLTLFNARDEKYNLKKHFGVELASYPNYRSIHLAESRRTESPKHIQQNMLGGINMFTPLN